MVPLAAAIRSMYNLRAQLATSWNQLYAGFCRMFKIMYFHFHPEKPRWGLLIQREYIYIYIYICMADFLLLCMIKAELGHRCCKPIHP